MRYVHKRLKVFISSTSDLTAYRDAVEAALLDLDIDGVRFETWPSAFAEGSQGRVAFLEVEFARVRNALKKAPEAMRKKREELGEILTPFFNV